MENKDKITVELEIFDYSDMGQGIGRINDAKSEYNGLTVFVEGAFPGDKVLASLTKIKKNYALGVVLEILEASKERTEVNCPYAGDCGGCTFCGFEYEGQLRIKEKQVRDKLTRLAGIENPVVRPIIGMGEGKSNYRSKAEFAIGPDGSVGFYGSKSHRVVDCKKCDLQMPTAMAAAEALRQYIKEVKPSIYNRKTEKGLLRGMVVKTAAGTGEVMVIIVATENQLPKVERLAELLDDAIYNLPVELRGVEYNLESIILNVNKSKTAEVLGEKCITLAGKPTITDVAGELRFEISPLAFYQVNPEGMMRLYGKAIEYAALEGKETVFDLYCGVGTIGLFAAHEMGVKNSSESGEATGVVYGIESVKGAILDANRNAVINRIVNARYLCGRAEEEIFKLVEGYTDRFGEEFPPVQPDIVILDPPRAGCDSILLEAVAKAAPKRIVYVSCDPGTLSRDVKILGELGYEFVEATPVDMFSFTGHVESVVLMTKMNTTK